LKHFIFYFSAKQPHFLFQPDPARYSVAGFTGFSFSDRALVAARQAEKAIPRRN
jgi:hypothetical protein